MENERLLSDAEIMLVMWDFAQSVSEEALDKLQQIDRFKMIARSQDCKTTDYLIVWRDEPCDKHGCWRKQPRRICRQCWGELKETSK